MQVYYGLPYALGFPGVTMKYLLLFAFLAVVWWVWSKRQETVRSDSSARQDPAPEQMVACVHCGVHLPESESVKEGSRIYCCEAHRLASRTKER
jgi:uncharacterized protein